MGDYQCDDLNNMQCGWCEWWLGKCDDEGNHSAFERAYCASLNAEGIEGGFVCRDFTPKLNIKRAYVNLIAQQQKRREAEGG